MEKLPKEENDFFVYMDKLNELYNTRPQKVKKEVRDLLIRLNAFEKTSIFDDIDIDKFLLCILVIVIAGIGLFNTSNISMYLGGVAFFVGGYFIGLYIGAFGLIFLFSHGVTGMFVMESALIGDLLKSSIMSDNPQNIYIYLGINIALFVIATLIVIIHNLSSNFRKKRHIVLVPLALYALAFIMSGFLPKIVDFIYLL